MKSFQRPLLTLSLHVLNRCILCCCILYGTSVYGQSVSDTTSVPDTLIPLQEVQVIAKPQTQATPVQVIGVKTLEKIPALQLSDALKHFSGVVVKDYGGIGGLKTVSVRGLGANHTGFVYDGVLISDTQSGQIDMGKFSIDNVECIALSNGGPADIFQPARSFGSASILSVQTLRPCFIEKQKIKAIVSLKSGSFGLINPSLLLQTKINRSITTSLYGEWQQANGRFPYSLTYGDSSSVQKRTNTDISSFKGEANIYFNPKPSYQLSFKTYYFQSERGLPGATIFYNPHSAQRLWDRSLFFQTRLAIHAHPRFWSTFYARYTYSYLHYLDPDYLGSVGKLENIYHQKEGYFSASALYTVSSVIQTSVATDLIYNTMDANLYQFAYPSRYSWLTAASAKLEVKRLIVNGTLLATLSTEQVKKGDLPANHKKVSPSLSIGYKVGDGRLLLRAFYKDIFRMPTFNDLYYSGLGNTKLTAESTDQIDLGFTYDVTVNEKKHQLFFSGDVYHNRVKNKIVALPTKNLFIWSMMNLGQVNSTGVDGVVKTDWTVYKKVHLLVQTNYSFQKVLDRTTKSAKTYGDQIAYTPVHSGSGMITLQTSWIQLSYSILFAGSRYILNQNIASNYLKGYSEHSLTASRSQTWGKARLQLKAEVLNLFNTQYELVKNFPMPGRSFRITLSTKL